MNKNIIALGFVSFFTDMASSMVTTILPLYIVYILNDGVDKLGYILAIATFISYGFRILFGYLSDKLQIVKPFVVAGYLVSAITKPLLYFSDTWQSVALLRGTERIGKAIRSATKDSLISAYSNKKSGKSFGFHKMMDVAGEMSGAIIAFLALYYLGKNEEIFRDVFALTLIPGILAVVIVIFFVKDAPFNQKQKTKFDFSKDYKLLWILGVFFGISFFMMNESFYIIKAKEAGYLITYIPLLVILLNLIQTLSSYFFGLKIDKFGSKNIIFISFLLGLVSLIFLYFDFIIIGFILLGLFSVSSLNGIRSYISNNAYNKATIYGVFYGGIAVSSSLGSITFGIIWQYFGENYAIIFSILGVSLISFIFRSILWNKS